MRPEVLAAIEFDEETGKVDRASVKKALAALAKAKPHLVAKGADHAADGTPPRRGTTTPKPTGKGDEARIDNRRALSEHRPLQPVISPRSSSGDCGPSLFPEGL